MFYEPVDTALIFMHCEIWILGPDATPELAGTFTLRDGRITTSPKAGKKKLLDEILATPNVIDRGNGEVSAEEDPVRWFGSLPEMYHGSYLHAAMIQGDA